MTLSEQFGNIDIYLFDQLLRGRIVPGMRVFDAGWAGTIRTIADLSGTWAVDPEYHHKIVARAVAIFG